MKRCLWSLTVVILMIFMQPALADMAVIDGGTADKVHLRQGRSRDQASLGLYFTGTQVLCESSPQGEWTAVTIGDQTGYMMEKYLVRGNSTAFMTMKQGHTRADCTLWQGSNGHSAVLMTLEKGTSLTVLGETSDRWYYVQAGGVYGYIEPGGITGTKTVARNIPFAGDSWWCFSSGAGAWRTTLHLLADGTFSGLFEDSDMGDTGTAYPNGTQYISRFSGRFGAATQVTEGVYYARVEALSWEGTADEVAYVDSVRVITREPYGLSQGDDVLICMPGVDAAYLTESQRIWVQDNISEGKVIRPVLINQNEDWGFCWTE